ncbi:hypothetical protein [Blastococcus sp. SYSU D00820]
MALALSIIVLLAFGLPLLAWYVGGRRFWASAGGASSGTTYTDMVRRHRLTPAEIPQVQRAMSRGRALTEPRLRRATADWAQAGLTALDEQRRAHPRRAAVVRTLLLLGGVLLLVGAALAVARGSGAHLFVLVLAVVNLGNQAVLPWLLRRNLQRAVDRNTGPAAAS